MTIDEITQALAARGVEFSPSGVRQYIADNLAPTPTEQFGYRGRGAKTHYHSDHARQLYASFELVREFPRQKPAIAVARRIALRVEAQRYRSADEARSDPDLYAVTEGNTTAAFLAVRWLQAAMVFAYGAAHIEALDAVIARWSEFIRERIQAGDEDSARATEEGLLMQAIQEKQRRDFILGAPGGLTRVLQRIAHEHAVLYHQKAAQQLDREDAEGGEA